MNKTYVVSDIHGEYKKFLKLLKKIHFHDTDKLYVLGDVVDRGDSPIKVIQYIMSHSNITMIKGNHEEFFEMYLRVSKISVSNARVFLSSWIQQGGGTTVEGFKKLKGEEQEAVETFIRGLPLYAIVGKYILVHSGIIVEKGKVIDDVNSFMKEQMSDDLLWSREEFYRKKALDGYTVVFGHTKTESIRPHYGDPWKIWHDNKHNDKIGIDCGAVDGRVGGRLGCLCLDTKEEFYV